MSEPSANPVRLKSAVRARSLAEEGVALSMGATAVVVRGSRADTVWRALEPTLRAGFERETLLGGFPERGRPFLASILDQLEEHGFLRELEPEPEDLAPAERAAYPHLESLTRRPHAALAALREGTVRVRSSHPELAAEAARALVRAGVGTVRVDPEDAPESPLLLTTRWEPAEGEPAEHLIASGGGLWLSGPRDRSAGPDLVAPLRRWFASRKETSDGTAPDEAASRLVHTLVCAQLALALVAHVARDAEDAAPAEDAEFMVTTDELVSEPRVFSVLSPLNPEATGPIPVWEAAEPPEVPALLDSVTHLWDRVFGPVAEPRPGSLPQLPVGLARSGTVVGCGPTTAEARLDALLRALRPEVWLPSAAPVGLGLGLTPETAIGAAVADLALRMPGERWKDVAAPDLSPGSRRLWAALTLRLGVTASLVVHATDDGLHRARVLPETEGAYSGEGVAPHPDTAVQEALLRAVASARLAEEPPGPPLDTCGGGTSRTLSDLARWAFETRAVRLSAPEGADRLRDLGVHSAVASWS
ncbi:hypothetical protein ACFWZ7_13455 [Nocardiopsis alba]|uniref:hypothetical protein n=1 Tax=Nocardiopsis alba TaxID=53437 RepID=UPI003670B1D2